MKFRAKIEDVIQIRQFAQLIHILSRCCKKMILRITADKLNFIVSELDCRIRNNTGATAYCELPKQPYFDEYAMEGVSEQDNEIFMEIPTDAIVGVLYNLRSSSSAASSLKLKLTKKDIPCFTIEIEFHNTGAGSVVVHDIPISLIRKQHWIDYKEPELPAFDVSFGMPELKVVQRSLERMKNMSNKLSITATKYGQLNFSIDTFTVRSTVRFTDKLKTYDLGDKESQDADTQENVFTVDVDMKSLLQLIPQENMKPNSFICSIQNDRLFHLFYIYGEITLQYFLPSVGS